MNVRMVNAVFEDRNRPEFDADKNTDEFIATILDYIAEGVRAFTVNLQGGFPGYEGAVNSAFNPDGSLRKGYLQRVKRVIEACDRNGAFVNLGCYYQRQDQILEDAQAVRTGVVNVVRWIVESGFINVVLEIEKGLNAKTDLGRSGIASCAKAICATVLAIASEESQKGNMLKKMTFPFPVAQPEQVAMDEAKLESARKYAQTGGGSGCIIRGGRLVMACGDQELRYDIYSSTKSISVTALGLAMMDGKVKLHDKAKKHLAGVDDRVKVAAPVCMVSSYMQGGCNCENAPGLRIDTHNTEFAAVMAPRPMMLVSVTGDWTSHTPEVELPAIKSIYELYG